MKKFLAIALVALIAMSSVFAVEVSLSGYAKTVSTLDLDAKTFSFSDASNYVKATWAAEVTSKKGEADIYAEVGAKYQVKYQTATGALTSSTLTLTKAQIVAPEWSVSILNAKNQVNFASSWEKDDDGVSIYDYEALRKGLDAAYPSGVIFSTKGYSVGFGADLSWADGAAQYLAIAAATPEYELGDAKVQVGATYQLADTKNYIEPSVKVSYATDDISVAAAVDAMIVAEEGADTTYQLDASAQVKYADLVTVDAFFMKNTDYSYAAETSYADTNVCINGRYIANSATGENIENYLSVKADVQATEDVTVSVYGLDLINTQFIDATVFFTVEDIDVDVYGGYHIAEEAWHAGADASKAIENVGTVGAGISAEGATDTSLYAYAFISNTTLIDGASLYAEYDTGDLLADTIGLGSVTAYAKIAF